MAGALDLTTLADVKAWLNIGTSASDAILAANITAASRMIYGYLARPSLLPRQFNERYDGSATSRLYLRNWPVLSVASVSSWGATIPAAPAPGPGQPPAGGYLLEPWDGTPPGAMQALDLFGSSAFERGRQSIAISYQAGYAVQSEPQTISSSPFELAALAPYGAWAIDLGVVYAESNARLTAVNGSPGPGQYSVASGLYTFSSSDAATPVLLSYGFVPQDLAQVAMELVAERFTYRNRIGEVSKSLGGQETMAFSQKDMPDALRLMLAPYRSIAVSK